MRLLVLGIDDPPVEPTSPRKASVKDEDIPFELEKYKKLMDRYYKKKDEYDENKAKVDAYNASLAPVAEAAKLISDRISAWKLGVQQTADELQTLRAGFFANPNDWTIRLYVDSTELQQYFPYGTVVSYGGPGNPGAYAPRRQGNQ